MGTRTEGLTDKGPGGSRPVRDLERPTAQETAETGTARPGITSDWHEYVLRAARARCWTSPERPKRLPVHAPDDGRQSPHLVPNRLTHRAGGI